MRLYVVIGCLLMGSALCHAAVLPKEVLPARETFEVGLQMTDREGQEQVKVWGDAYLRDLRKLERDMQSAAQFRWMVAAHDEIVRFTKERTLPAQLVPEPMELHNVQAIAQWKLLQLQYSNECVLVKLAGTYVKELEAAYALAEKKGGGEALRPLEEERDRVVTLDRLRRALDSSKVRPPSAPAVLSNVVASAASDSDRLPHRVTLFRPAGEALNVTMDFDMRLSLAEDMSHLKTVNKSGGAGSTSRTIDGQVAFIPRIVIACQRGEILSGSRLVIEYYSRSLTEHSHQRESVESIVLPRIASGGSHSVDAKGIQLHRTHSISTSVSGVSHSVSGSEFYGLILHVVSADGGVLMQRFAPQALEHELAPTPPEK